MTTYNNEHEDCDNKMTDELADKIKNHTLKMRES